jgi:hypothetical protein
MKFESVKALALNDSETNYFSAIVNVNDTSSSGSLLLSNCTVSSSNSINQFKSSIVNQSKKAHFSSNNSNNIASLYTIQLQQHKQNLQQPTRAMTREETVNLTGLVAKTRALFESNSMIESLV